MRGSGENYGNNALNLKKERKKGPTAVVAVGPKANLLFFYLTKEYLLFLYITVIEVLQSLVKSSVLN